MPRTTVTVTTVGLSELRAMNSALSTFERNCQKIVTVAPNIRTAFAQMPQSFQNMQASLTTLNRTLLSHVTMLQDVARTNRQLQQVLNQTTTATNAHGVSVSNLASRYGFYRGISLVWLGIAGAVRTAFVAYRDFEVQSSRVSRVLNDQKDLPIIRAGMAEQISRTGASIEQLGEAYYQLGTHIKDQQTLFAAVNTAMNLVIGTQSDVRETTRAMIQLYEQFGDQLDHTASDAEKFRRVGELLAISFKDSSAEMDELTQSLKYLGPIAEAARIPLEQVIGTVTALTETGQRGRMSGTAAAQFVSNLAKNYNAELGGIVRKGFVYQFKEERTVEGGLDLEKTLKNIINIARQLPTDKAEEFLQAISGSQQGFRFLGTQGVDSFRKLHDEITKAKDALEGRTREAEKLKDTMMSTPQEFARLWNGTMATLVMLSDATGLNRFLHDIADAHEAMASLPRLQTPLEADASRRVWGHDAKSNDYRRDIMGSFLAAGKAQAKVDHLRLSDVSSVKMFANLPGGDDSIQPLASFYAGLSDPERNWLLTQIGVTRSGWGQPIPWDRVGLLHDTYATQSANDRAAQRRGYANPYAPGDPRGKLLPKNSPDYYNAYVEQMAQRYGLDPRLMHAIFRAETGERHTDSSGNVKVSRAGAIGIGQLMPSDAKAFGVNPYDEWQNIRGSMAQMSKYASDFPGKLDLQIAAYNAGEGAVKKYHGVPPYRETQDYVQEVFKFMGEKYNPNLHYRSQLPKKSGGDPLKDAAVDQVAVANALIEVANQNYANEEIGDDTYLSRVRKAGSSLDSASIARARREHDLGFMTLWNGGVRPSDNSTTQAEDKIKQRKQDLQEQQTSHLENVYNQYKVKYGIDDPRTQRAAEAWDRSYRSGLTEKSEIEKYGMGMEGPLVDHKKELRDHAQEQKDQYQEGWRNADVFGLPVRYNRYEFLRTQQDQGVDRLDHAMQAVDLTQRPNLFRTPGTSGTTDEIAATQKKLALINQEIEMQSRTQDTGKAYQEQLETLKDRASELANTLSNLKDKAEAEAIEKTIKGLSEGWEQMRVNLEAQQSQPSFYASPKQAQVAQAARLDAQARLEQGILDQMKSMESYFGPNAIAEQERKTDAATLTAQRYPAEKAVEAQQAAYERAQSTVTGAFLTMYQQGAKSPLGAIRSIGDAIVEQAMTNFIQSAFAPLIGAISGQILAIEDNTAALRDQPATGSSRGPTLPGNKGKGGAGGGGSKTNAPGKDPLGGAGRYVGAATADYSIYQQGAQHGVNLGGILGGAMSGAQIGASFGPGGGLIGGIIGGVTNLFGGLFGHHHTVNDNQQHNPSMYNTPNDMNWGAYQYRSTGGMGSLPSSLRVSNPMSNAPIVNVTLQLDGVSKAVSTQITQQTGLGGSSSATAYMDYSRPVG